MSAVFAQGSPLPAAVRPLPDRCRLPSTGQLLVAGGDARIALDPQRRVNQYGCRPLPDPELAAFGSSTASVVSTAGFAAADRLRERLLRAAAAEPPALTYGRELERIRQELLQLCGVSDLAGVDLVFAASGTDLHLIAAQLARGMAARPTLAIVVEVAETGSGVPAALAGRHFSNRAALGQAVSQGALIAGSRAIEVASVAVRLADGSLRSPAAVDAEVESLAERAHAMGWRVLLVLVDVSKTGMIAPSPACVAALRARRPDTTEVLVDGCQFRMAPPTLRAYLQQGFMVALTGSKFVSGPTFSGALLLPEGVRRRWGGRLPPATLAAYSARAEWPRSWATAGALEAAANFGLLLRWEAALAELRAFSAVPPAEVKAFLQAFAAAVRHRLGSDPAFEALPVGPLDRSPLVVADSWDRIPTIFPFLLSQPAAAAGRKPLSRERTQRVYRLLQTDLSGQHGLAAEADLARLRCQLGQPVACGVRDGVAVGALRLCASARLIVEATAADGRNARTVIDRALAVLDKTALLAAAGSFETNVVRGGRSRPPLARPALVTAE